MSTSQHYQVVRHALERVRSKVKSNWTWSQSYIATLQNQDCAVEAVSALSIARPARVLDFGCGNGLFSAILALQYPDCEIHAIDADGGAISDARALIDTLGVKNVQLRVQAKSTLPYAEAFFGYLLHRNVLHLIQTPRRHIADVARTIEEKGTAVFQFPYDGGNAERGRMLDRLERLNDPARFRHFRGKVKVASWMSWSQLQPTADRNWEIERQFGRHVHDPVSLDTRAVEFFGQSAFSPPSLIVRVPFLEIVAIKSG